MRIVFLGAGDFALPTLRRLADSEHDIPLVVTQPARKAGRGRRLTATPVAQFAAELGIETMATPDVNEPEIVERLRSLDARLGLVIDFGQKIGPELLAALPGGCINLHASLLPKYRGAAPINHAIMKGEKRTGCTVFRIIERMDAGHILVSRWTAIKPEETAGELHDRLAGVGVDAVEGALALYADGQHPEGTPQDEAQATRAPKLKKSDGIIRFDSPAVSVARHICGLTPWPGARTRYQSADGRWEDVAITRARRVEATPGVGPASSRPRDRLGACPTPGTIDSRLHVAAADGYLELLEVKPSSGRLMSWPDYVNGRRVAPGDKFVTPDR